MKGLLLKEFYVWLKTRSWIMIYILLLIVSSFVSGDFIVIGILCGGILGTFLLDEKSGWTDYHKTLPCTPFQRVSAKYIVTFAEFFIAIIANIVSNILLREKIYYTPPSDIELYSKSALIIACSAGFLAFLLPICFKFKGTKRTVLGLLPAVAYFLLSVFAVIIPSVGNTLTVITAKKWLPALIAVAGLIMFAASWMVSVIIESGSDKNYRKKFKTAAVILIIVAVALSGFSAGVIYKYVKAEENSSDNKNGDYIYISDIEEIKKDFNNYYTSFCNEFHLGITVDDCAAELKNIGYFQNQNNPEKLYSGSSKINVNLTTDEETGKISSVFAYCNLAEKRIDNATYEDFHAISSHFAEGMSQEELHQKFNELEIFPCSIHEHSLNDNQPQRCYTFRFSSGDFNGEFDKPVVFKILIETDGESVIKVEENLFKQYDESTLETTEAEETPLEKATREMSAFIAQFCNETHIEETPRECIKKLRNIGFLESEDINDLYYSEDRKISVSLATTDKDKLKKITAIANYGELRYIDSATEQEMKEFTDNFVLGMTENQLQQKLVELDAMPDIISEHYTDKNEHLRCYEIKYRIGDYNGSGAATYSLTIDVTDGKVNSILVF